MTVKTGTAWAGTFVTLDATGALEAGTPSGVLYVDGVADAATVTITGSNPYKWSVTLPSLTAGQRVDMYITATISTIATAGFVASEQADTALVSEVKAETASILEDTGTTIPGTITTIDNEIAVIDGIVDNILEDTGTTLDTKINTIDDFLDTEVAAILADTNELQTDLTNGGRLDLLIDAIKAKTDNLPADPADDSDIDAQLAAIKAETALIVEDTGTTIPATLADLALEATLTAIKGAGWTNETLAKIVTDIAAISAGSGATAEEVWEYVSRTLTQTATSITSSISGSTITDVRGDTWSIDITDLTLDSNKQQFAIKRHAGDADSAALLFVDSDDGLLYINGAAGTAGDASLSYAGTTLTLTVKPAATATIPTGTHLYGIQSVTAAGVVNEAYGGTFTVQADVVKATA